MEMEVEQLEEIMRHIKSLLQVEDTPEGYDTYLEEHPDMKTNESLLLGLALAERMGVTADLNVATQLTEGLQGLTAHLGSPQETTAALSLSRFYRLQERLEDAEAQLNAVQALIQQHGQDELRSGLALEQAALFQQLHQPKEALRVLDAAMEHLGESDDTYGLAQLQLERGQVYHQLDQIPEAMGALQASLALQAKLVEPDPIGLANTHLALGQLYRIQKQFSEAEDAIHKALPLYQSIGDARGLGNACVELARLYQQLGHHEGTEAALQNALEVFQQAHLPEHIYQTYQQLASLYQERKRFEDAAAALRQALALAKQHGFEDAPIRATLAQLPETDLPQ